MTLDDLAALREQLIAHEGLRLTVYTDTVGKATIGVGRNLVDKGISHDEAMELLDHDVEDVTNELFATLPWTQDLDAIRQRVLIDIGFNVGMGGLLKFARMLAAVQRHDYAAAATEIVNSHLAPGRAQRLAALMRS